MPYITEAGARPWSDVINETGDRVRSAFQGVQEHNARVAESNRAVHPAAQKWLQKMLSEGMDPSEAAAAAHAEIDANNNGVPDSKEGIRGAAQQVSPNLGTYGRPESSIGGNATEPGTPAWAPEPEAKVVQVGVPEDMKWQPPGQGLAALSKAPAAPKPSYASGWKPGASDPSPFLNRDMPVVGKILDYKQSVARPRSLTLDEQIALAGAKGTVTKDVDNNKAGNTLVRDEKRANTFAAAAEKKAAGLALSQEEERALKWKIAMLKHKTDLDEIQIKRESTTDAREIAELNNRAKIIVAKIAATGRFGSSINSLAGDEDTKKMSDEYFNDVTGYGSKVVDSTGGGVAPAPAPTTATKTKTTERVKAKSSKPLAMDGGKQIWGWSDDGKSRRPKYADGTYGPVEAVPLGVTR